MQARGIERDRQADDDVTDLQVGAPRSELDHSATELVAHHRVEMRFEHLQLHGVWWPIGIQLVHQPAALFTVTQQVQVAAADATGQHLGQHLAGPRCRIGEVVDSKLPISHHRGAHAPTVLLPAVPVLRSIRRLSG